MQDQKHQPAQHPNSTTNQCKVIQNYAFSNEWKVGAGSFSEVFKGFDIRNKSSVAMKRIKKQSLTSQLSKVLLEQEIKILKELDNENVIRCLDVIQTTNNCYIITEFCKFGDLSKLLRMKGKFTEPEISKFVYQIYKGLKYLRGKNIIHRDFKTANIFVDQSSNCKIADFGFAIKNHESFVDVCLGSPTYMTPEAIYHKKYGPKTDVWAFGVVIYELVTGKTPLADAKTKEELQAQVLIPPPISKLQVSVHLKNFLDKCLTVNPESRISIEQMENHQYIRQIAEQLETSKLSGSTSLMDTSQAESVHSSKSSRLIYKALQNPLTYQQAVSILQYCRLLSRVCQYLKSPTLEQWLLKLIYTLTKSNLKQNQPVDYEKYKETVANYCNRYHKQFKGKKQKVRIDDALKECEQLFKKETKFKQQMMAIGTQTNMLYQSLSHPLGLLYYAKVSCAVKYIT